MSTQQDPTFTALLDWVEGRLDEDAGRDVEQFVEGSADARASVEWIREYLHAGRSMPLRTPPDDLRATLRGLFRERLAPWAPASYVDGHLDLDTRTQAVAGARAADDQSFHLRFDADDLELLLTVTPASPEEVDVRGSVRASNDDATSVDGSMNKDTAPGIPGRNVVFTSARRVRRHAVCDGNGDFRVSGLEVGVDEIWVDRPDSDVQTRVEVDLR